MLNSISDNDLFIYLLLAAKEDISMQSRLLSVLRKDDLNRSEELERWAQTAEEKKAHKEFVEASRYFNNRDVAYKAMDALSATL